ncbi:uncharacterized protein NFIA_087960 [Aspergillus fischeri NRRL 181]|uniref:Uncharacterized protein n=1 Tax=Neosartorya fischeri (strain ATCC 1020 / DSM 3700 / CBS 544.65 / FGSC A1164 / JCM 1740 / NRRL 181 / WB 181) TaxID=331117 RepID=A1DHI3_NEOFI|nr:uncharacterized protein NFIA_087960 [Aspergillus fischeri NRRL 181]EAW18840.1 hypothetical protein NFIA_087960 [Aspergillus fischeri NRRL 181]
MVLGLDAQDFRQRKRSVWIVALHRSMGLVLAKDTFASSARAILRVIFVSSLFPGDDKTLRRSSNEEQTDTKPYTNTFCHSYSTSHVLPFPHDGTRKQYEILIFALLLKFPAAALPEARAVVAAQVALEVAHPRAAGVALGAVACAARAFRARVAAGGGPLPRGSAPAAAAAPFVSAPGSPMAAPAPAGIWAAAVQFFSGHVPAGEKGPGRLGDGALPRGAPPASAPTPPFVSAPGSPMAAAAPVGFWSRALQFFAGQALDQDTDRSTHSTQMDVDDTPVQISQADDVRP